jgi:hypothetical protein
MELDYEDEGQRFTDDELYDEPCRGDSAEIDHDDPVNQG